MSMDHSISVLGCGNIGLSIAHGLVNSGLYRSNQIILTKRNTDALEKSMGSKGFQITSDNSLAVKKSKVVIVCVTPAQLDSMLEKIKSAINPKHHVVISVVSGASIDDINLKLGGNDVAVVRAMPNTAIQHCQSMTCLAVRGVHHVAGHPDIEARKDQALAISEKIFNVLGTCIVLKEEQIVPATALCACGIAFFCRAIRAASQGGIEIGFHAEDAIKIAAQTAKGAATLLLEGSYHPEYEIDKVTTPQGCTIAGLNQMEHSGFSSAMIKGIVTSAEKAASLYNSKKQAPAHHAPAHHAPAHPQAQETTTTDNSQREEKRKNKPRNPKPRQSQQQQDAPNQEKHEQSNQPEQAQEQQQPAANSDEQRPRRGKNSKQRMSKKEQEDPNNPWKNQENNEHPPAVYDVNSVDEALAKARSRSRNQSNGNGNGRGRRQNDGSRHQNGRSHQRPASQEAN